MSTSPTNRAERLLDLVSLFVGIDHPLSWQELVSAFPADYGGNTDSAQRKWSRDRAALLELGIPIQLHTGEDGEPAGYAIDRQRYFMRDLALAPEERAILSVAGAAALEQPDFPLRTDLAHALNKLNFVTAGERGARPCPRLVVHLPSAGSQRQPGVLEDLGKALAARKEVQLHYRAFDGQSTERLVAPYGLAYRRGAWFLVARCYLRNALRIFQVERITSLTINPNQPKVPDFSVPKDFDLQAAIGREPWEFAVHPAYEVKLLLSQEVALLAQSRFGARAKIEPAAGGAVLVRLSVTYGEAIVREVLRLAPHAQILEPRALRQRAVQAADRIASAHRGQGETPAVFALDEGARLRARGRASTTTSTSTSDSAKQRNTGRQKDPAASRDLRERLRRALFIIPYVVAHPGCTVEELASASQLTPGQLLAELDFLRMIGRPPFSPADLVDIDVFDGKVQVSLPQGLQRVASLTPLEAAALDAAASALAVEGGDALAQARRKLRDALPPESQEEFDSVAGRVLLHPGGLAAADAVLIDQGIAEHRELELTYWTAGRGEASRRTVRPLERILHQGYWYLHAYCTDRKDRRLFRLDRATDLALTDRPFVPRAVDDAARFRRESIYEPSPYARVAAVRIDEGPWAAEDQARRLGALEFERLEGGGAEALFPVDGEAYVAATVLSLAGEAQLLAPADARERVRRIAQEAAALHRDAIGEQARERPAARTST